MDGHATPAERPFGIWTASALVVGLMIGVGIYGLPAELAPYGWTGLAGWGLAAAGTLACVMALNGLLLARPGGHGLMARITATGHQHGQKHARKKEGASQHGGHCRAHKNVSASTASKPASGV